MIVLCSTSIPTSGSSTISVLLNKGDGTFGARQDYSLHIASADPFIASQLLIGDLNGDSYPDVAATATRWGLVSSQGVEVLLNAGIGNNGTLLAAKLGDTASILKADLLDINGDKRLDIAYVENDHTDDLVGPGWATGDGNGTFSGDQFTNLFSTCPSEPVSQCNPVVSIATGDINDDGITDLVYAGDQGPCIMLGNGKGNFTACAPQTQFKTVSGLVTLSDLTQNNHLDIISASVQNSSDNIVSVLTVDGNAHLTEGPKLYDQYVNPGIGGLISTDFNGDGLPDVALTVGARNEVVVFLNTSSPATGGAGGGTTSTSGTSGSGASNLLIIFGLLIIYLWPVILGATFISQISERSSGDQHRMQG